MTRYVPTAEAVLDLARAGIHDVAPHELIAPTLVRSQTLAMLYAQARDGAVSQRDAKRLLEIVTGMRMRLLGDRVVKSQAWRVAEQLGWGDTFTAEYVALAQLKSATLVTDDPALAAALRGIVEVAGSAEVIAPTSR